MARKEPLPAARPNAAVTVDCVIFGVEIADDGCRLKVMLVERGGEPFKGTHALPGGFVEPGESLDDAARRELREETGLRDVYLEQLYTFGEPGRDPRGRVVSVAYYALTNLAAHDVKAGSDAAGAQWHELPLPGGSELMAFDHGQILEMAMSRLRAKVRYAPIGFHLLPPKFTLRQLQCLYQAILGKKIDKANFRRKILATGTLVFAGTDRGKGRPGPKSRLYKFRAAPEAAVRDGFHFEI